MELAISWLREKGKPSRVLETGIGSGCISVSIALGVENSNIVATELSYRSLMVARQNIEKYDLLNRVSLVQADLLSPLRGKFDLLCANLPYIPTGKLKDLDVSRHEPAAALDGGADGLFYLRKWIAASKRFVKRPGLLLAEIEENQADRVITLAEKVFPQESISVWKDYAGKPRILRVGCEEK